MKNFIFLILFFVSSPAYADLASWYDSASVAREGTCKKELCYTASGKEIHELERRRILFAASNSYKLGTKLRVCSDSECVDVVILDRGGFTKYGRSIDLCRAAFQKIGSLKDGLQQVTIKKL
jgi:rare lipoprotein A